MSRRAAFVDRLAARFADEASERRCGHKKRFGSRREVLAQAKNTWADHPLGFYKCPVCRGWHLTSRVQAPS